MKRQWTATEAESSLPELQLLEANAGKPGAKYIPAPADDLYALGVVLYRLLTDAAPYVAGDDQELIETIVNRVPVAPHILNPLVPEALGQLCMRMLAKRPEDRPESAEVLVRELEALGAGALEAWDVPLCDAHGPDTATTQRDGAPVGEAEKLDRWVREPLHRPRRGKRPAPVEKNPEPAGTPPSPRADMSARPRSVWLGLAALALVFAGLGIHHFRPPLTLVSSPPLRVAAPHEARPDQEVAKPRMALESERGAEPTTATTPAPVAAATFQKDEARLKTPRKKNGLGSVGRNIAGVAGAASVALACPGGQVRSAPPPESCPPGAAAAMKKLGIAVSDKRTVTFPIDGNMQVITVREGPFSVRLVENWRQLPPGAMFHGRLIFGDDRVYGRLTEARTPDDRFPVCLELLGTGYVRGLDREPDCAPGATCVFSSVDVEAVDRFE